jgi:hypothetical protein
MPLITTIIARGLAVIDYLLAQWVDLGTPVANASPNGCWEFDVQNVTLNACGQEYLSLHGLVEFIELWAETNYIVMGGILAVNA